MYNLDSNSSLFSKENILRLWQSSWIYFICTKNTYCIMPSKNSYFWCKQYRHAFVKIENYCANYRIFSIWFNFIYLLTYIKQTTICDIENTDPALEKAPKSGGLNQLIGSQPYSLESWISIGKGYILSMNKKICFASSWQCKHVVLCPFWFSMIWIFSSVNVFRPRYVTLKIQILPWKRHQKVVG
jgi:hypothetical protein